MTQSSIPLLTAHGAGIPAIGFGTSQLGACAEQVAAALTLGYRHIDTAWKYDSEEGVGAGIRASGVPREQVFLVTKVSHEYLHADAFARSVDQSLARMRVDYVDLLHVHWPNAAIPLAETMQALAKAKRQGLARHVGVANFNIAMLEDALRLCPEPLVTLQVEYHPYLDQSKVLAACRRLGLVLTAYCPLARGRVVDDPVVAEIARARGKTAAQIALRWLLQQGSVAPIPRSANAERIAQNLDVFNFTLSEQEMAALFALKRANGRTANPPGRAPAWD